MIDCGYPDRSLVFLVQLFGFPRLLHSCRRRQLSRSGGLARNRSASAVIAGDNPTTVALPDDVQIDKPIPVVDSARMLS